MIALVSEAQHTIRDVATRYSSGCRSSRDDTYGTGTYVGTVGASLYRYHGTYGRYRTGRYMEERKFEPISNRDSSYPGLGVVEVEREPCQ